MLRYPRLDRQAPELYAATAEPRACIDQELVGSVLADLQVGCVLGLAKEWSR
jgi:hypothetical protein